MLYLQLQELIGMGTYLVNDFASLTRPDLTENCEDQLLCDGGVQVSHVSVDT